LSRTLNLSISDIEAKLNAESGMKALAGHSDLRVVEAEAASGNLDAQLAIQVYAYRARKYIGAYAAAMGGLDALIFTGGIGENSASMRRRICDRLHFIGLHLDDIANQAVVLKGDACPAIQAHDSRIAVLVTQTAEQWMIAKEAQQLLQKQRTPLVAGCPPQGFTIPVAVSARHVHLSQTAVEALFGAGYQLSKLRDLSQPEGWAANETVTLIGPKGAIERVRVLGPTRSRTQIEVSKTDTFALGVDAPVRPSGMLDNTPKILLRGTVGELTTDGLIIAARHIHMHPDDARRMGLADGDFVDVRLGGGEHNPRAILFTNTQVRVKETYVTEMHIDTDEANAAGINIQTQGELIRNDTCPQGQITSHHAMTLNGGDAAT
jgi:acetate kinase